MDNYKKFESLQQQFAGILEQSDIVWPKDGECDRGWWSRSDTIEELAERIVAVLLRDFYKSLKVTELKDLLKKAGKKVSGAKDVLVNRLIEVHFQKQVVEKLVLLPIK